MAEILKLILEFGNSTGGYAAIAVLIICIIAYGAYLVGKAAYAVMCYAGERWVTPVAASAAKFFDAQAECVRTLTETVSQMSNDVAANSDGIKEIRETQMENVSVAKLIPEIHKNTLTCLTEQRARCGHFQSPQ